jgi:hypothetical protein
MTTTEPKHSQLSQFYHHHLFLAIAQSKQFKAAANKTRLQLRPLHQFKPKIQNQQSPSINLTKPRPVPPSISLCSNSSHPPPQTAMFKSTKPNSNNHNLPAPVAAFSLTAQRRRPKLHLQPRLT